MSLFSDVSDHRAEPIYPLRVKSGEVVDVFRRFATWSRFFVVPKDFPKLHRPIFGLTDGWTEAVVHKDWDIWSYDVLDPGTWVEVRWCQQGQSLQWRDRCGVKMDTSKPEGIVAFVQPEFIRLRVSLHSEAHRRPLLSLLHVRWGGSKRPGGMEHAKGPLYDMEGGVTSDSYIKSWEDTVFKTLGPNYEIISAFVQSSDELDKICPRSVLQILRGPHVAALYFLFPIAFQDCHGSPGFVENGKLLSLMAGMEAAAVPTRFPHPSHLYRSITSKEWMAQMCLHPFFRVPLTVQVSRQAIVCDPTKAAAGAIQALRRMSFARSRQQRLFHDSSVWAGFADMGVAKLGWSWEATDVMAWHGDDELQRVLTMLIEQDGGLMDKVFVQEWVDFDVEMRLFVVEPDAAFPETFRAKFIRYTSLESVPNLKSAREDCRNFRIHSREEAAITLVDGDDAALADAEQQAALLINTWLTWFLAQQHELPTVLRFDFMVKRIGPGRAFVVTGELTELGGSFLGWHSAVEAVFGAVMRSCFSYGPRFSTSDLDHEITTRSLECRTIKRNPHGSEECFQIGGHSRRVRPRFC